MPGRVKCQVFCVDAKSGGNLLYFAGSPFFVNHETTHAQFGKTAYFCRKKNKDKMNPTILNFRLYCIGRLAAIIGLPVSRSSVGISGLYGYFRQIGVPQDGDPYRRLSVFHGLLLSLKPSIKTN